MLGGFELWLRRESGRVSLHVAGVVAGNSALELKRSAFPILILSVFPDSRSPGKRQAGKRPKTVRVARDVTRDNDACSGEHRADPESKSARATIW